MRRRAGSARPFVFLVAVLFAPVLGVRIVILSVALLPAMILPWPAPALAAAMDTAPPTIAPAAPGGPAASPSGSAPPHFQVGLAASVITAALAFVAPRALDAVPVPQLALWGLAAPSILDPTLTVELRDGAVVLTQEGRIFFSQPAPKDDVLWGALAAEVLQAAANASAAVRQAGTQTVLTTFFDELFNHLDPYSRYVPPEAADKDRARRTGEAGVGMELRPAGRGFVVSDVNASGPAAAAGIRVGDTILSIEDQPVQGETLDTVMDWLTGEEGTPVILTYRGRRGTRTVELERIILPPETVFPSRLGDLLVLRIAGFAADTDLRFRDELTRALTGAAARRVRGLVLDLRGNRGGLLRQAVSATDMVLSRGVIASTAGRSPQAAHLWRADEEDLTQGRPIVVLVDGRTASAAEIMAGALSDQGRAVVVGSATLGKGLVQTIATLPDGGELFVSWSRVLAPAGWPIQGLGVMPQICTTAGDDAAMEQLVSLDRGVLLMSEAVARHRAARPPLSPSEVLTLRNPCPAAEPREADMMAAKYLLAHPKAYQAALETPP